MLRLGRRALCRLRLPPLRRGWGAGPRVVMGPAPAGRTTPRRRTRAVAQASREAGFAALTFRLPALWRERRRAAQCRVRGRLGGFPRRDPFARDHVGVDPERVALWGPPRGRHARQSWSPPPTPESRPWWPNPVQRLPKAGEGSLGDGHVQAVGGDGHRHRPRMAGLAPEYIGVVGQRGDLGCDGEPECRAGHQPHAGRPLAERGRAAGPLEMMRYKPSARAGDWDVRVVEHRGRRSRITGGAGAPDRGQRPARRTQEAIPTPTSILPPRRARAGRRGPDRIHAEALMVDRFSNDRDGHRRPEGRDPGLWTSFMW